MNGRDLPPWIPFSWLNRASCRPRNSPEWCRHTHTTHTSPLAQSMALSLTLALTLIRSLGLAYSHSYPHSRFRFLSHSHPHSHSCSRVLVLSVPLSPSPTVRFSLPSRPRKVVRRRRVVCRLPSGHDFCIPHIPHATHHCPHTHTHTHTHIHHPFRAVSSVSRQCTG
ncbi:hypothetical protein LX36DRAFT_407518 [Colletotrichum falcatum]|nr:hypothetical protein LX36DRAFT_407518 [Colletotrichum falcatum]